ncbi:trimeric intracellular cation channel family protein [Caulobacter mirabilis]|uniref:Glycine transporter domain-containing protein n=1 Tax=Caulobacter mirabilis TaxID=69666 RepID=A0A2D2B2K0_9CAUL|nr:trimeric intracellular cation channel family protein [Caulobacter mirabilis]ATQ44481.1 hypothetical protein CSW64_19870 [Caulobacter mirabilis]
MTALDWAFVVFDYAAVAVFGATGALAAARRKEDIVTFAFFAAITGVGGGTLRDLLIGAPVFWVNSPGYLIVCVLAALAVWVVGERTWRYFALLWLDAVGLSAYAIVGAAKALTMGVHPVSAVVMGVLTATFGGVIRDVLAVAPSVLLRRELYVSCALAGAAVFVILTWFGLNNLVASGAGFLSAFAIRAGAIRYGWALRGFPGKDKPGG